MTKNSKNKEKIYSNQGLCNFKMGNYKIALAKFNESLKINSKNPRVYKLKGDAYLRLNEYKKAINNYNKSLHYDTENIEAYKGRAKAAFKVKQYSNAIRDYSIAVLAEPNNKKLLAKVADITQIIENLRKRSPKTDKGNDSYGLQF